MLIPLDLFSQIVDAIEAAVGVANAANATHSGKAMRLALAMEDAAGAISTANTSLHGWLTRAVLAAEAVGGTGGTGENQTYWGLVKRLVDALEVSAGSTAGSLASRFLAAALNWSVGTVDWLLATGFWSDAGVWDDSASWID